MRTENLCFQLFCLYCRGAVDVSAPFLNGTHFGHEAIARMLVHIKEEISDIIDLKHSFLQYVFSGTSQRT